MALPSEMKRLGGVHDVLYYAERPDGRFDVKHDSDD